MNEYKNIGLLFNKHYFKNIKFEKINFTDNETYEPNKKEVERQNKILLKSKLDKNNIPNLKEDNLQTFNLETTYPGLFTGSGYAHESSVKGELKLGFYFDYTSGLPCIPGSSVKGMLRSVFPDNEKREEIKKAKTKYIKKLIFEIKANDKNIDIKKLEDIDIIELEKSIFEGQKKNDKQEYENISLYKRDVFFDAFPVKVEKDFLANDYITPHGENLLKNPTPLQFLKVLPQVDFQFRFILKNTKIDSITIYAQDKKELFRKILLDFGIGAKTNVGYGQFEPDKKKIKPKPPRIITKAEKKIVAGAKLECKVVEIKRKVNKKGKKKGKTTFMFEWDKELKFYKNNASIKIIDDLKVGDFVEIEISESYYPYNEVRFNNNITKK